MTSKHTPGPWTVHYLAGGGQRNICDDANNTVIASLHTKWLGDHHDVQGANARLIAAAPEMLEVLENLARWVGGMASSRADDEYEKILTIISKARGEVP
jgi:hypothetical protein